MRPLITVLILWFSTGCLYYDTSDVRLRDASNDGADLETADVGAGCDGGGCCEPELDVVFCNRLVKNCGPVTAEDNCGAMRTADCGVCTAPAECGGGGTENVCACADQTDEAFCALLAECGPVTGFDSCGQMRTVNCGDCAEPETCGGTGQAGACGCSLESDVVFCSRQDACGVLSANDNCGIARSADCGACPANEDCVDNRCVCVPESDQTLCTRLNSCGPLTANDNCGTSRTIDCGGCPGGEACAAGRCACAPETDAAFCTRLGAECGSLTANDNCANARMVASCGACSASETCAQNECLVSFPPAGLDVWLRSDEGITIANQNRVQTWADRLTGETWDALGNSGRPQLVAGHAGIDALRFYGGDSLRRSGNPVSSTNLTMFVVGFRASTSGEGPILGVAGGSALGAHELNFGTTPTTMRFASESGLMYSASVLDTSTTQILTFRADGQSFEFYQNGALTASTPHAPSGPFEFDAIGSFYYQRFLVGDLQEVLIWERALTAPEIASVLQYLTDRYSL